MKSLAPRRDKGVIIIRLREWKTFKLLLREREADAVYGGYCTDFGPRAKSGTPGNPTQARAIRLASDKRSGFRRFDDAFERALMELGGRQGKDAPISKMIRAHYLQGYTWGALAERWGVSVRTAHNWHDRFIDLAWIQLGRRVL